MYIYMYKYYIYTYMHMYIKYIQINTYIFDKFAREEEKGREREATLDTSRRVMIKCLYPYMYTQHTYMYINAKGLGGRKCLALGVRRWQR